MSNLAFQKWINEGSKKKEEYLTKNGNQTELSGAAVQVIDGGALLRFVQCIAIIAYSGIIKHYTDDIY